MFKKSFKILLVLVLGVFFISGVSFAGLFIKKDGTAFNGELAKSSIKFTTLTGKTLNIHSADIITMIRDKSRGIRIKTEGKEAIWGEIVSNVKVKTDKEEVLLKPKDLIFYYKRMPPTKVSKLEIIEYEKGMVTHYHKGQGTKGITVEILPEYWVGKVFTISNPKYPKVIEDSSKPVKFSFDVHRHLSINYMWAPAIYYCASEKDDQRFICYLRVVAYPKYSQKQKNIEIEETFCAFPCTSLRGKGAIYLFLLKKLSGTGIMRVAEKLGKNVTVYNTISNVLRLPIEFKK